MLLIQANEDQRNMIKKDIGYEEETMKAKTRLLKEWLKKQPHLPELPGNISVISNFFVNF